MGMNEKANENLNHTILTAASLIGVDLKENEIKWITRVGSILNHPDRDQGLSTGTRAPRPIIVCLLRRGK